MTFNHKDELLLKRIEDGELSESDLENILGAEEKTPEPTKTVLGYLRDIVAVAKQHELEDQYVLFGGYGVLAHLVSQWGDNIVKLWRGSDDIDIAGSVALLNSIRSVYEVVNDKISPNLDDKRTLKIYDKDHTEKECKIDYVMAEEFNDTEEIVVLGVPLRVANPINLIKSKLPLYSFEDKQAQDVSSLLGVCEHRKIDATYLVDQFEREDAGILRDYLIENTELNSKRLQSTPSKKYIVELRQALDKRRI